jgi:hypothetical protein
VRRRGLLDDGALEPQAEADQPLSSLAVSAVSGRSPPAGPEWRRRMLPPLAPHALAFDKSLCASLNGFTLHAATHAGALDLAGREPARGPPYWKSRVLRRSATDADSVA